MAEIVRGFRDFTGEETEKREKIIEILKRNFRLYGFEPAETPIIEYENFVKQGNEEDEAVSDIFKLEDKGKRKLALRYEFTFQLKRIAKNKKLPYKRYQIGPVFRDEPVTSNRFRQFTQADVDIVGATIKEEAEILALTSRILRELKIKAEFNVNNRKLLNEILDKQGIKNKQEVIRIIDKLDKKSEKEVKEELKKCKAENLLTIFKKPKNYFEKYKAYSEIKELENWCKLYGVKINFQPSLARGLSYYNGTIFEIKTKKMKETICAGGSYLVNGIQSTGISFGIERLSKLAKIDLKKEQVLILSIGKDDKAVKLSERLRDKGISCLVMYGRPTKALEYANSKKIEKVLFVGEEEVRKGKYKLRDMKTGKEVLVDEEGVGERLK